MIHENIELTGSFSVTGSLTLPNYPSSASHPTPITGSMYNDTGLNAVRFYDGVQWQTLVSGSASGSESPSSSPADIEYLLVAGGGGGGGVGGAGGAGGLLSSSLSSVESGSSFTITVGSGGPPNFIVASSNGDGNTGTDGGDSSIAGTGISTVTAIGGGGGAGSSNSARDGGSGGGSRFGTVGSGTAGQGFDGGDNDSTYIGGGGGGASEAGNPTANNGGDGKQSSITGTATYYAGGGGGGGNTGGSTPYNIGTGGQGGGADGGANTGTANTGGGGGGGTWTNNANYTTQRGGTGGSGVAIFAYPSSSLSAIGGSAKTSRSDGYVVHTFNSSGTLTVGGADDFPVINNEAFGVVTYTGNGNNSDGGKVVTGLNFQPDLMFVKNRTSSGENWAATDVVSGFGKILYPNLTNTQVGSDDTYFTENSDGFDVNTDNLNVSTHNYVAWCWKAGGSAVSAGGTNLTNRLVSANPSAGFSIMTYTGNSSDGTIEHGLTQKPELWIFKNRSAAKSWFTLTNVIDGSVDYGFLNTTDSFGNASQGDATTTILNVNNDGSSGLLNANGNNYVAYAFHSVDGYQKIGSYSGTGVNGNDITTGFRPRFLLVKRTNTTDNWVIVDVERGLSNSLFPDDSSSELNNSGAVTVNSTGFEVNGNSGGWNNSTSTYIYLAIA